MALFAALNLAGDNSLDANIGSIDTFCSIVVANGSDNAVSSCNDCGATACKFIDSGKGLIVTVSNCLFFSW